MIEHVLADVTVMRWPAGQRFCYLGTLFIAAASPTQGALLDDSGLALSPRDLAGILKVDARTVDRFLERALLARRLRTRDGVFVVPEITTLLEGEGTGREAVDRAVDAAVEVRKKARPGPDLVMQDGAPPAEGAVSPRARAACLPASKERPLVVQDHRDLWDLPGDLLHAGRRENGDSVSLGELEHILEEIRIDRPQQRRRLVATILGLRAEGLPFAAFARALEQLKKRRRRGRIDDEAAYFATTLRGIRDEEYAQ